MTETLCAIENLTKEYDKNKILNELNFKIHKKEILGIVGKSGAGKSTLMKILSGIIEKYDGKIKFENNKENSKIFKELIGFSFQPYSFYEELTLKDNLIYFGKLYDLDKKTILQRSESLFKLTDLDFNEIKKKAKNLSGGMKKRFDIICSLLHYPEILILDEPSAGLDPVRRKQLINIIKKINNNGVTIIISSHILKDIDEICDRILIIDKGKKLIIDKPSNIKSELLEQEKITIKSYPGNYSKIQKVLSNFKIIHSTKEEDKLIVYCPETEIIVHFLLHLLEKENELLEDITITEPDLENIFTIFENQPKTKILKQNISILNSFIFQLIGKKFPEEKVKQIMLSHKWPTEIVNILVGKRVLNTKNEKN